ncbi:Uncharacterised protein [Escherichia coli]|nr:Uncharacterised protein [Escherichia coli]
MNFHGIVSGAVRRVNPFTDALVYRSRGSTQQADYFRVPEYEDSGFRQGAKAGCHPG